MHSNSRNPESIRYDYNEEILPEIQSDYALSLKYQHNEENYSVRG
ncbi:hypothetical protein [Aliikangiella sp. IMCC44359]